MYDMVGPRSFLFFPRRSPHFLSPIIFVWKTKIINLWSSQASHCPMSSLSLSPRRPPPPSSLPGLPWRRRRRPPRRRPLPDDSPRRRLPPRFLPRVAAVARRRARRRARSPSANGGEKMQNFIQMGEQRQHWRRQQQEQQVTLPL